MKGECGLKITLFALFCAALLFGNAYFVSFVSAAQNATTTGLSLSPPSREDAQSFWQKIKDSFKGTFETIKRFGEGNGWFKSFFENIGQKIGAWWSLQAKPWFNKSWYDLNNYLNQEIRIQ
ncbi:hypothetical protein KJ562_02910 [Patescibacteria group bacterium]|nr:hypothetical protein [Patescibacteria group bacterium]MBU4162171.1 hypothetical protein [Patescibacteria group bacterium]